MRLKLVFHRPKLLTEGQLSKLMLSASLFLGQSAVEPKVPERKDGSTLVSALCPSGIAPPSSIDKIEEDITEGCPAVLLLVPSRVTLQGSGQEE